MMKKAQLLALCTVVAGTAHAAVTGSVAAPTVTDLTTASTINLTTGSLDWFKFNGSGATDRKSGVSFLTASTLGGITQGNYTPASGGFTFTWTDGTTTPTQAGTKAETNFSSTAVNAGWEIRATGLAAGTYQMNLYSVRTDGTPFSLELYDNTTFLSRQTLSGDAVFDGNSVDNITGVFSFTVGGTSDIVNARFIRDAVNGTATAVAANNILAIGAVTLTAVPEPSTYGLMGAGAIAAAAMLRRRRNRAA